MNRTCAVVLAACLWWSGCGTYSMLRSAETLPAGKAEVNAGMAANGFGEVIPVGQIALGLSDRIEVLGHFEVWNVFAEARGAILKNDRDGLALTVGVGGGAGSTALEETADELRDVKNDAALTGSVAVGKNWSWLDVYLSNRTMWLVPSFFVNSTRLGVRLKANRHVRLILEGGVTVHDGLFAVPEATVALGTGW